MGCDFNMVFYVVGYFAREDERNVSINKDITGYILYNPSSRELSRVRAEHIKNLILCGNEVRGIYTGSQQDILNCNITPLRFTYGVIDDELSDTTKRLIMRSIDEKIAILDKYSLPVELYCIAVSRWPKSLKSHDMFYTNIVTIDRRLNDVHYFAANEIIRRIRVQNYTQIIGVNVLNDNISYNLNGKDVAGAILELDSGVERLAISLDTLMDKEYSERFIRRGIQLGLLMPR